MCVPQQKTFMFFPFFIITYFVCVRKIGEKLLIQKKHVFLWISNEIRYRVCTMRADKTSRMSWWKNVHGNANEKEVRRYFFYKKKFIHRFFPFSNIYGCIMKFVWLHQHISWITKLVYNLLGLLKVSINNACYKDASIDYLKKTNFSMYKALKAWGII